MHGSNCSETTASHAQCTVTVNNSSTAQEAATAALSVAVAVHDVLTILRH
jgi:hypothetical protein